MAARRARRGASAVLVIVVATVAVIVGGRYAWRAFTSAARNNSCSFGSYQLDLDQAQTASTMVSVVIKRGLPERAAVLTIGAALQESKLRNIPAGEGDRDSVGVLQQRPSQGWGTEAELSNVSTATTKFLDALIKLPNWQSDSLAEAVQSVQISADGQAYAKHEAQATSIAKALMGSAPAGVNCAFDKPTRVAAAGTVASQLRSDLPINPPGVQGKVLHVRGASWATAAWFVAHANQYGIDSVSYGGKKWTRADGWKDSSSAGSTEVAAELA